MMRRIISLLMLTVSTASFATSSQSLITAARAYSSNNTTTLANMYNANPNDQVIGYLYAKNMLNSRNTGLVAEDYVDRMPGSYMKNDLLHQLLPFYYNLSSYSKYKAAYNKITNSQISANETCGFDVASIRLNNGADTITDINWLANDNITSWCADLGLLEYKRHTFGKDQLKRMMTNLVIYGDLNAFNEVATQINIDPVNFSRYKSTSYNSLPRNQYLIIQYISNKAKKHPDDALNALNSSRLDNQDKTLLANYIALQFAAEQKFTIAISLFEKYSSNNISSDEFEWRARSYLARGQWKKLITAIKSMPQNLQDKNVWLYWLAKSYDSIGQYGRSTYILKQIPKDYSYYYLLAQGELQKPVLFDNTIPKSVNFGNDKFANEVDNSLYLYQTGKANNSSILATIGLFQWFYLTRTGTPNQLIAMSVLSRNKGYYDLSISAANKLDSRILPLSFPTPYLQYYQQFSRQMGISSSYPLAISRQESRFNATVVAFDGGEGLMQIMPATAAYISRKSRYAMCSRLSAECNIKYGTWYLGNLYHKFGSYIYASAGYNGGPNRAKRWQANLSDLDNRIQMEVIPIQITRDYVQKVLVNKAIYDTKLANSNKLDMLNYVLNLKDANHDINNLNDDNTDASKL